MNKHKKSSGWQSTRSGKSISRQRIEDALARGEIRQEVQSLGSDDRSRLLMLGDLLLFWSETIPGRVALAVLALFLAWVIL